MASQVASALFWFVSYDHLCVSVCGHMCATECIRRSEGSSKELVLCFCHKGPVDQIQITRLGVPCFLRQALLALTYTAGMEDGEIQVYDVKM